MTKTLEESFIDWEASTFGCGYGSGEHHVLPVLKRFFELCTGQNNSYDYRVLERELTPIVTWLLINALSPSKADVIEYGTSPRYGWLTKCGRSLREFICTKTNDELVEIVTGYDENHIVCYRDVCNCGPNGYDKDRVCQNPFWQKG